jgi:hypothetical protein
MLIRVRILSGLVHTYGTALWFPVLIVLRLLGRGDLLVWQCTYYVNVASTQHCNIN